MKWTKNEDAIALFTRLNIGKIKLTNAELVKALFLSQGSASNMTTEKAGGNCSSMGQY
jgi:hypothetical protein